jgi:hypothetical protein
LWEGYIKQATERVKIFPQKNFALKVGLGREELQGISLFHPFSFFFSLFVGGTQPPKKDDFFRVIIKN